MAGEGPSSFDGGDQGRLFSRNKCSRAADDLQIEVETRPEDVLAEQAVILRLPDRDAHALDGQGVFVADVDETPLRPDRFRADDHPLDDGMRIGFQDGPVHERARVALVAVADEIFRQTRLAPAEGPFPPGGKAGAAASPEARVGDLGDDFVRRHAGQGLAQGLVAVVGDRLLDFLRIDPAAVAEDDEPLMLEEIDVRHPGNRGPFRGRDIHEFSNRPAFDQVLLDEFGDVPDPEPLIEDALRLDHDDRTPLAESVASRGHDEDFIPEPAPGDFLFQRCLEREGSAGYASGSGADENVGTIGGGQGAGVLLRAHDEPSRPDRGAGGSAVFILFKASSAFVSSIWL